MTAYRSILLLAIAAVATSASAAEPAPAGTPTVKVNHRRALLIGINEYKNFRKLNYCGADVRALGKQLIASGFDADKVVLIHDEATRSMQPDREKILAQITLVLESAQPDDLLLLAFSGHGVRINGKSYLVPFEGELPKSVDDEAGLKTLISLDWVYEKLQGCRASMKLFLVDACQNRPFKGDQLAAEKAVPVESVAAALDNAPKGVLLLTACAAGEVSHEAEAFHHGIYTHFLLDTLEGKADYNHDGIVSLFPKPPPPGVSMVRQPLPEQNACQPESKAVMRSPTRPHC